MPSNKQSTIPKALRRTVDLAGDSTALIYDSDAISYATLHGLVLNASCGLSKLGIKSGDRVAFWIPNTPAYLVLYLACMQLNAIAVAVNTRFRGTEVADIINRSGASCLILWPFFRKVNFLEILSLIEDSAFSRVESVIVYSEDEVGVPLQNQLPLSFRSKRVASYQELINLKKQEVQKIISQKLLSNGFNNYTVKKYLNELLSTEDNSIDSENSKQTSYGIRRYELYDKIEISTLKFNNIIIFLIITLLLGILLKRKKLF